MDKATMACKLTSPELLLRKRTVIAGLKESVLSTKETETGFYYTFAGSDTMLDLLHEFIKTERECCTFFAFDLHVSSERSSITLGLSGPQGTKGFIKNELDF